MAASQDQPVSVGNLAAVVEALRNELGGVVLYDEPTDRYGAATLSRPVTDFGAVSVLMDYAHGSGRACVAATIAHPQLGTYYFVPVANGAGSYTDVKGLAVRFPTATTVEGTGIKRVIGYK